MTFPFRTLFSFPEKKERFIVIEILHDVLRIGFFKVNFPKSAIEVIRIITQDINSLELPEVLGKIKKHLRGAYAFRRGKALVGLDPLRAATIHASARLVRDNPKEPIEETELENHIAQGIWKIFDHERGRAARKMDVGDLDVVLSDVRVKDIKLDNHKIVSPVGFKAKAISFQCIQTFTPRAFVEAITEIIPSDRLLLIGESGIMAADIMARTSKETSFLLIQMFEEVTDVFLSDGATRTYVQSFNWGKRNLLRAFADAYSVSEAVAERMIGLYYIRQASPYVLKKMEKVLFGEFQRVVELLRPIVRREKVRLVYLMPLFDFRAHGDMPMVATDEAEKGKTGGAQFHEPETGLPEFVFGPRFRSRLGGRVRLKPMPQEHITERLGFHISSTEPLQTRSIFSDLVALLDFSFLSRDDKVNKVARRHARWLTTNS